jgi:hypothetical protein
MNFLNKIFGKRSTTEKYAAPQSTQVSSDDQAIVADSISNFSIDKKFIYDIKTTDLKVLGLYSNNPRGYLSFIKTDQKSTAILKFFEYVDSSFVDNIKTSVNSGALVCKLFFDMLDGMGIEEAYLKIKTDLSQKGLIKGGESLILLNTGFAETQNISSFTMLIGVLVIADNASAINVVSSDNIHENKVKFNLKP